MKILYTSGLLQNNQKSPKEAKSDLARMYSSKDNVSFHNNDITFKGTLLSRFTDLFLSNDPTLLQLLEKPLTINNKLTFIPEKVRSQIRRIYKPAMHQNVLKKILKNINRNKDFEYIPKVLKAYSAENNDIFERLAEAYQFDSPNAYPKRVGLDNIAEILPLCTEKNKSIVVELLNNKSKIDKLENYAIFGHHIISILKEYSEENHSYIKQMLTYCVEDSLGISRFSGTDLYRIPLLIKNKDKKDLYDQILSPNEKNDDGSYRIYGSNMTSLLEMDLDKEQLALAKQLIGDKSKNKGGAYRFNSIDLEIIVSNYREPYRKIIDKLVQNQDRDASGNFRMNGRFICSIVLDLNDNTTNKKESLLKIIETLLKDNRLNTDGFQFFVLLMKLTNNESLVLKILNGANLESLSCQELQGYALFLNIVTEAKYYNMNLRLPLLVNENEKDNFKARIFDKISELNDQVVALPQKTIQDFSSAIDELDQTLKIVDFNKIKLETSINKGTAEQEIKFPSTCKALEDNVNQLTAVIPEFVKTVNKIQSGDHIHTLDIHILEALKNFVTDPDYQKLSAEDKFIGKIAVFLHDIEKNEGMKDILHTDMAANLSISVSKKLNLTTKQLNKLYILVKNSDWTEVLAHNKNKINEIAFNFRMPGMFELAKTISTADIKAVSHSFYDGLKPSLDQIYKDTKIKIDELHSKGIYLPQTIIPTASELKLKAIAIGYGSNQTENKVIKLKDTTDFEALGFPKGTSRQNFFTILHGLNSESEKNDNIKLFKHYNIQNNENVFSATYYSIYNPAIYEGRKNGFIFLVDNENILAANNNSFGSGGYKSLDKGIGYLLSEKFNKITPPLRTYFGINEYIKLYRGLLENPDISNLENKVQKKIINIIAKAIMPDSEKEYNELVVYAPSVSAVFTMSKQLDEIPYKLRKYAQDNNLPIMIL